MSKTKKRTRKPVDLRAMLAKLSTAAERYEAECSAYNDVVTDEAGEREHDERCDELFRVANGIRNRLLKEVKRLHGITDFDRPRAVNVDGSLVVLMEPDSGSYWRDMIVDAADVVTVDPTPDRWWVTDLAIEVRPEDAGILGLEARCVHAETFKELSREKGHPWSGVELPDGSVLAIRSRTIHGDRMGFSFPETPERLSALRRFRSALADWLEDREDVDHAEMIVGGNGGATFRVSLAADDDGPCESLFVEVANDPNN